MNSQELNDWVFSDLNGDALFDASSRLDPFNNTSGKKQIKERCELLCAPAVRTDMNSASDNRHSELRARYLAANQTHPLQISNGSDSMPELDQN